MIDKRLFPSLSHDSADREARSCDFGRMTRATPAAVAVPNSTDEVASIVRSAARRGLKLAIRGGGHSQSGQSLTDGGLVVDTTRLDRVEVLDNEIVRAQAGAEWGKVVDSCAGAGRLPRVLVDTGEVTVGGALSAGGFGTTSHRYGMQIGQVEQLEVVTGTGARIRCSRRRNRNLFDAVRGGQGQFGIITEAWIRLRRAGTRIRQYELLYRDSARFQRDFERLVREKRFDHLRAQTRVHQRKIVVSAGVEYDRKLDDGQVLDGLGHDEVLNNRDTVDVGRAGMYPKWLFLRKNHHPWRDWFMPWKTLPELITQPWLDPVCVPRFPFSWIGMYPINTDAIDAPLFMRPEGEIISSYSVLAVLSRFERADELASRLRMIDRTLVGLGGKGYLSGCVGYGPRRWQAHYGDKLKTARDFKQEFDPHGLFRKSGMPFGQAL